MLAAYPSDQDSPLFQLHHGQVARPLTDSTARKHLKYVSSLLGLSRSLTFHDFRRGGPIQTWGSSSGDPSSRNMVLQLCLEIHHTTPLPPFSGSYHLYVSPLLLTSSPYLYWVFGALLNSHINLNLQPFYTVILFPYLVTL